MVQTIIDKISCLAWLKSWIATKKNINSNQINNEIEFSFYGLDSIDSVELAGDLEKILNHKIEPTILFNYPTIIKLSDYLLNLVLNISSPSLSYSSIDKRVSKFSEQNQDIAIIGMSCRFPQANNLTDFWKILLNADDAISSTSFGQSHYGSQFSGGFLSDIDFFANEFFNITPREAKCIDPQQRLLLELSFHALEDAGITRKNIAGSNTGVFIGIASKEYEQLQAYDSDIYAATGSALSIAANRLSYFYDLKGPSLAVDTACSSSLMAVHLACNSLKNYEANLAIAGGANLLLLLQNTEKFAAMGFLSPEYRCKTFDKSANGYVRSEGIGLVILKRLEEALQEGDRIYAVIKATASNQDGHTNGITAPNQSSQEKLLQQVYRQAGIEYSAVNYVECHGTGTALGDPIEVGALNAVLGQGRTSANRCRLGSVKTNIGHLEAAAGIAGLIKVALMVYHKKYVPNLHFNDPNPAIDFNNIPFIVQQQVEDITAGIICGMSSFGFGGTNVHAVLTDIKQDSKPDNSNTILPENKFLIISANTKAELKLQKLAYQSYLKTSQSFSQLCSAAAFNRDHYPYRMTIVAKNNEEALAEINRINSDNSHHCFIKPKLAFVFTGQGSQWPGMAKDLLKHTVFRKWIMICDSVISEYTKFSILEILQVDHNHEFLSQSKFIQPILVAFQIALSEYLRHLGIIPDLVLGHSVGEIAAAYIAGALSLEHTMLLAVHRGQVMDTLTGQGAMLAVKTEYSTVKEVIINCNLDIAAINSFSDIVVAGSKEDITAFATTLDSFQIEYLNLPVNYAFHSQQLDFLIPELKKQISQLEPSSSSLTMISTVSGELIDTVNLDASYWAMQMRKPIKFLNAIQTALDHQINIIIEIGASSALIGYIQEIVDKHDSAVKVIGVTKKNSNNDFTFIKTLASLYEYGCAINWDKLYSRCWVDDLPHYQWQRYSYWCKQPSQFNFVEDNPMNSKITILNKLTAIIASLIQMSTEHIDTHKPFIELGADSIIIVNAIKKIQTEFNIKIEIRRLFEDLQTIDTLADFIQGNVTKHKIAQHKQVEMVAVTSPITKTLSNIDSAKLDKAEHNIANTSTFNTSVPCSLSSAIDNPLTHLFSQQLGIMNQQLQLLSSIDSSAEFQQEAQQQSEVDQVNNLTMCSLANKPIAKQIVSKEAALQINSWQHRKVDTTPIQNKFSSMQQQHMKELVAAYTQKTAKSKALVDKYRYVLADSKASVGFRMSIKEMLYPIVGQSTYGSKLFDVDGNEYVDITMGFGVHLCGYKPKFITNALLAEANSGLQLGPRSPIVGEVAALIAELTGLERVAFSNTGTESVITAMRIARAATGKNKIVLFKKAYHGHSDYALVEAYIQDDNGNPTPITPGIPRNVLDNTLVLEYGDMNELDKIRQQHDEIAAVLIEPVQSGRPDFQPIEFVRELRKLTTELEIALIFDEMVTGFRSHPGGAQAIFGIKADMATYGKIIGGGLPIGVIAGSKHYMDHIDGGLWQYGDNSYPQVERTFFGGTFCQHPTSLATAAAILQHLKQEGPQLQEKLNAKTAYLAKQLNDFFISEQVPIEVVYFASLFRFKFKNNFDLLFYYLIMHGVYVWEWRNCFLSTAHSDEDIEKIINAVKQSIYDMKKGGFLS